MTISGIDHCNFATAKPEETLHFYCNVLGFTNAPERRPAMNRDGTWILVNGYPAIHVNFVDRQPSESGGVIDHIAFRATGIEHYERILQDNNISYRKSARSEINLTQIFLKDPNGIGIELSFADHRG